MYLSVSRCVHYKQKIVLSSCEQVVGNAKDRAAETLAVNGTSKAIATEN